MEIFYEKRDKNLVIANVLVDNLQERGFSNCVSGSAWGKLYRKKILQNSSFDEELFLSEDRMFNLDVFSIAERIGFTDSIWYFYYQYNHSAIHSYHKDSIKNMSKLFEHCLYRIQVNSGIESYISKWMMSNIYICIFLDLLHKDNRRGFMFNKNRLLKWFYSEEWKKSKEYFTYKDLPIHTKIAAY
ncbi:MAG: hypothetical protein J5365_04585, partial [Erysipelotrichaceae bacterium]|nr:hypothetical protein [Erysipelotrichaceae bacterium]